MGSIHHIIFPCCEGRLTLIFGMVSKMECTHYWIIESGHGASESPGTCNRCRETRMFQNYIDWPLEWDRSHEARVLSHEIRKAREQARADEYDYLRYDNGGRIY